MRHPATPALLPGGGGQTPCDGSDISSSPCTLGFLAAMVGLRGSLLLDERAATVARTRRACESWPASSRNT
jgi:hypothetical protein